MAFKLAGDNPETDPRLAAIRKVRGYSYEVRTHQDWAGEVQKAAEGLKEAAGVANLAGKHVRQSKTRGWACGTGRHQHPPRHAAKL